MTIDTQGQMVMKSKQQLKEDFGIALKPIATLENAITPLIRRGHSASPAFLSFLFYPPFHSLLTLDGLVAKICFSTH
jgi:hypothetical protein